LLIAARDITVDSWFLGWRCPYAAAIIAPTSGRSNKGNGLIRFECDKCGAALEANDAARYIIKIEAYAAAGPIEFSEEEMSRDHSAQIQRIIEELNNADPDRVEDQTYRSLRFDLCAKCHRAYLDRPLG
jgi:hypothetical protein